MAPNTIIKTIVWRNYSKFFETDPIWFEQGFCWLEAKKLGFTFDMHLKFYIVIHCLAVVRSGVTNFHRWNDQSPYTILRLDH